MNHRAVTMLLPWASPSQNVTMRMHWANLKKLKRHWSMAIAAEIARERIDREISNNTDMPAIVLLYRFGRRQLDQDNFVGGAKFLIDLLSEHKLIVDDSPKWVEVYYRQLDCLIEPIPEERTLMRVVVVKPRELKDFRSEEDQTYRRTFMSSYGIVD